MPRVTGRATYQRREVESDLASSGYGVRDGGIKSVIKLDGDEEITLLYFEQIPWYFRVFLHTLKISPLDDPRTAIKPGERCDEREMNVTVVCVFSPSILCAGQRS